MNKIQRNCIMLDFANYPENVEPYKIDFDKNGLFKFPASNRLGLINIRVKRPGMMAKSYLKTVSQFELSDFSNVNHGIGVVFIGIDKIVGKIKDELNEALRDKSRFSIKIKELEDEVKKWRDEVDNRADAKNKEFIKTLREAQSVVKRTDETKTPPKMLNTNEVTKTDD